MMLGHRKSCDRRSSNPISTKNLVVLVVSLPFPFWPCICLSYSQFTFLRTLFKENLSLSLEYQLPFFPLCHLFLLFYFSVHFCSNSMLNIMSLILRLQVSSFSFFPFCSFFLFLSYFCVTLLTPCTDSMILLEKLLIPLSQFMWHSFLFNRSQKRMAYFYI